MIIALLTVSASLPEAHSLKDKRMLLRSLKDRVRNRMNVSVAETDFQDQWQRAELAFVTVAATKAVVEKRLAELHRAVHGDPRLVVIDVRTEWL